MRSTRRACTGTAAIASGFHPPTPTKEDLNSAYFDLRNQIDEIVAHAKAEGSLQTALNGLNAIRHTLDSMSRLSGFDRQGTQVIAQLCNPQAAPCGSEPVPKSRCSPMP
jgi:hypothetical protein